MTDHLSTIRQTLADYCSCLRQYDTCRYCAGRAACDALEAELRAAHEIADAYQFEAKTAEADQRKLSDLLAAAEDQIAALKAERRKLRADAVLLDILEAERLTPEEARTLLGVVPWLGQDEDELEAKLERIAGDA